MTRAQSRRSFLQQAVAVPVVASWRSRGAALNVISEPNCLSEESAQGFRTVLGSLPRECSSRLIVLSAASAMTGMRAIDLRRQAEDGSWVIWESSPVYSKQAPLQSQRQILGDTFGIALAEPVAAQAAYACYSWPLPMLTRTFLSVIPVTCTLDEAIGCHHHLPIAMKRPIGRGGIVFLGSMLGPHVRAGDREATQLTAEMLGSLTRGPRI